MKWTVRMKHLLQVFDFGELVEHGKNVSTAGYDDSGQVFLLLHVVGKTCCRCTEIRRGRRRCGSGRFIHRVRFDRFSRSAGSYRWRRVGQFVPILFQLDIDIFNGQNIISTRPFRCNWSWTIQFLCKFWRISMNNYDITSVSWAPPITVAAPVDDLTTHVWLSVHPKWHSDFCSRPGLIRGADPVNSQIHTLNCTCQYFHWKWRWVQVTWRRWTITDNQH